MRQILTAIEGATGISHDVQVRLLISLGIVVVFWLLRFLAVRLVWRRTDDPRTRYLWRKSLTYITVALSFILIVPVWSRSLQSFATFAGLASAGVAIALKDLVANIAGWIFIVVRRPFTLGDRVQIGSTAGDVIDIRIFQFTLMEIGNWVDADQSTGRVVHIPNGKVFTEATANYSKGFYYIWNEIPMLLTFESDWEKAKRILRTIAGKHAEHLSQAAMHRIREASKKYMIYYSVLDPAVYTSVRDSGILLTIRYLCEPRKRRGTEQAIWEEVLREFEAAPDIEFAYPTTRFYDRRAETGPRPPAGPQ
jgi:small-conductance mechanosensitive channel